MKKLLVSLCLSILGTVLYYTKAKLKYLTTDMMVYYLKAVDIKNTNFSVVYQILFDCMKLVTITCAILLILWGIGKKCIHKQKNISIYKNVLLLMSVVFFISGAANSPLTSSLYKYIRNISLESTLIEEEYTEPGRQNITFPQKRRNLIHIYVESLENSCKDTSNGGMWDYNLLPNLTKISCENTSFSGWKSVKGTNWTMAGLVAQTSGLPILRDINGNPYDINIRFFPQAYTLSDILDTAGYQQLFICGSDADFGYRKDYFIQHKCNVWDLLSARAEEKIPYDYYQHWGFEDEKLYAFAKDKLSTLAADDAPFSLSLLTADMHYYDGYLCRLCEDQYPTQYENVIACSDRQIDDFIKWLSRQDYYQDTTIIISGDHLYMDNEFYSAHSVSIEDREISFIIINPADGLHASKIDRPYTSFDIFPTTLAAIGAKRTETVLAWA